jgi:hypothetical protein
MLTVRHKRIDETVPAHRADPRRRRTRGIAQQYLAN